MLRPLLPVRHGKIRPSPPVIFAIRVFVFAPHGVFIRVPIDGYELALALVWVEAS